MVVGLVKETRSERFGVGFSLVGEIRLGGFSSSASGSEVRIETNAELLEFCDAGAQFLDSAEEVCNTAEFARLMPTVGIAFAESRQE